MANKDYDKDLVKKVGDKGLFDDHYDSLVLSQTEEERLQMEDGLEKSRLKHEELARSERRNRHNSPPMAKKKAKKASLFMRFISFFIGMFSREQTPQSSKFLAKRELKSILNQFSPLFYDFNIKKVRTTFPEYIYSFYTQLKSLDNIFLEVFQDESQIDFTQKIFFLEFVDQLLADGDRIALESVNESYFEEIISRGKNPTDTLDTKLKDLKNQIEQNNRQAIIHYTSYFEKLIYLSQFSFVSFFKIFDLQFSDAMDYKPKFQPVFGDTGSIGMMQLNTQFQLIDFPTIPENILIHFDEILTMLKAKKEKENDLNPQPISKKKVSDEDFVAPRLAKIKFSSINLVDVVARIFILNKKEILDTLIKVMTDNYDYEPSRPTKKEGILYNRYIKLTMAKKRFEFEKSYGKIKAEIIQNEILKFFKIATLSELMVIENYTEDVHKKLVNKGMDGFLYVQIASVYKTFHHKLYETTLRKFINVLLVEGDFINKREQRFFSEAYYGLDKSLEDFNDLDNDLTDIEGDVGQIIRYADGEVPAAGYQALIARKLIGLESQMGQTLKKGLKDLRSLRNQLEAAIKDWRGTKPQSIANVKTIAGSGNRTFFTGLIQAKETVEKFLDIMDSYPVMQGFYPENE